MDQISFDFGPFSFTSARSTKIALILLFIDEYTNMSIQYTNKRTMFAPKIDNNYNCVKLTQLFLQ